MNKNFLCCLLFTATIPMGCLSSCSNASPIDQKFYTANINIHNCEDAKVSNNKFELNKDFTTKILNINLESFSLNFKIISGDTELKSGVNYNYDPYKCILKINAKVITSTKLTIDIYYDSESKVLPEVFLNIDDENVLTGFKSEIYLRDYNIIIIPKRVKKIGYQAFADVLTNQRCHFNSLILNDGLNEISDFAFSNCDGLFLNLIIPSSVTKIGDRAFYGCSNLFGKINFPENLTSIGSSAFFGCTSLQGDLIFNKNLQIIGDNAFQGCENLDGILKLPDSLIWDETGKKYGLGVSCFSNCYKLKWDFYFPKNINVVPSYLFFNCKSIEGDLNIHDNVKQIDISAFNGCEKIKKISKWPKQLETIGEKAFYNCTSLNATLHFPDNLKTIGSGAFMNCKNLNGDLNFPAELETISNDAFNNCERLNGNLNFYINDRKKTCSIGDRAFYNCSTLKKINSFKQILSFGNEAFAGCSNITLEGSDPQKPNFEANPDLKLIGKDCFKDCSKLEFSVDFSDTLDVEFGEGAFAGVKIKPVNGKLLLGNIKTISNKLFAGCFTGDQEPLTKFNIPITLEEIGNSAFENCNRLDVVLPDYVPGTKQCIKNIGNSSFFKCHSIQAQEGDVSSVYYFHEGLLTIGESAFESSITDSKYIDTLHFPNTITRFGRRAFFGCNAIKTLIFDYDKIPDWLNYLPLHSNVFGGLSSDKNARVQFPKILLEDDKKAFLNVLKEKCDLPENWQVR